jgi:hypothetical protein
VGQARVRITMMPAPAPRQDYWPWILGVASAAFLAAAVIRVAHWNHLVADYHYWAGREAARRGEAQIVIQKEWQEAIALDPAYARVRLDLARSYIDSLWYGGAIQQAEAVLKRRRTRAEASLAWTYIGYCHYMQGDQTAGIAELELAVADDAQNSLAQSVLERLRRDGKLEKLP